MLKIGDKIPEFELKAYHEDKEKTIKLADYRGKWLVLIFYPADFTFICPTELGELAENYHEFKKLNAEILSVSTDTVYVHKAWHDASETIKKITFPMVADPTAVLAKLFGVYMKEEGLARRGTFIIDPDGVLQTIEVHVNNIGRSAKELLRKLQAAQFVREHKGNVCPASWSPGDKTLRADISNVGKI